MSVQATRVRDHPDGGAAERIRLTSDPRMRPGEGSPEGGDSQYRHHCWSNAFDAPGQRFGSSDELLCAEFVRARRRFGNQRGDAEATLMQMCEVFGKEARGSIYPSIDDARPVEGGIEAVTPAAAEMRLHRDGAQAGINTDEQKPSVVPEQVRQAPATERIKRIPGKPHCSTLGRMGPCRDLVSGDLEDAGRPLVEGGGSVSGGVVFGSEVEHLVGVGPEEHTAPGEQDHWRLSGEHVGEGAVQD